MKTLVKIVLVLLILIIGVFIYVKFPQLNFTAKDNSILLSGTVESTQIDINSEVSGKIISIFKNEGDFVEKDDVIASVDSSMQQLQVLQQESIIEAKKAQLSEVIKGSRKELIHQASIFVDLTKKELNYWEDRYNRYKELYSKNSISETALIDVKHSRDIAADNHAKANSQYSLIKEGSTEDSIKAAKADLETSVVMLEQAQLNLSKCNIKSPDKGTILFRSVEIGDMVNIGSNIATITNLSDLWIKVYIYQKHLGLVSVNQELLLNAVSIPNKPIHGKIIRISDKAEFTPKNTETKEAKENTVFQLKIKILDYIDKLRPGMTIEVEIPKGTQ